MAQGTCKMMKLQIVTQIVAVTYLVTQILQNFDLDERLLVKSSLVAYHLNSSKDLVLMVTAFHHLAEAAFSQDSQRLIPVRQLIVVHHIVVSSLVIIACNFRCNSSVNTVIYLHTFFATETTMREEQKSQGKKELTKIAAARGAGALNLLAFETQKIDLVVGHDLTLLKFGQMLTTLPQHRCAQNLSNFG
jgi:hypothetical protein